MRLSRILWLFIVPFFFTACGLSDQQKADYAAVQRSGVSAATYDKMLHGDTLSISDIENLSQARVNNGVILRYIREQGTIYTLNTNDVIRLRRAGVDQSVIDYMLQSARAYDDSPYLYPYGYDPFWYGPYGPSFGFYSGFGYGGFHHGYGGYHGGGYRGGGGYHH